MGNVLSDISNGEAALILRQERARLTRKRVDLSRQARDISEQIKAVDQRLDQIDDGERVLSDSGN